MPHLSSFFSFVPVWLELDFHIWNFFQDDVGNQPSACLLALIWYLNSLS
jgi:hypothetical protein